MTMSRRVFGASMASAALLGGARRARAQDYPSSPVRIVVPFPPGNFSDLVGRLLVEEMQNRYGATLVVDNRAGATGAIGVQVVTQAQPDGYSLLLSSNSPLSVNAAVRSNLPFDIKKDLEPISLLGWTGYLLVVPPDFPARTLAEAVQLWRASPGQYTAANPGTGTAGHLITELVALNLGTRFEHAPYRGSGQALMDVNQNRAHLMIDAMTSSLPQVQGKTVRPLCVMSPRRSPLIPEVPSIAEAGVPELANIDVVAWAGLFAPARTPAPIVQYWSERSNVLLRDPKVVQRLAGMNVEAAPPGTPRDMRDLMEKELVRWTDVARKAGIATGG
ncbi:Bug family tripartite tricarboxylate transporter substrate binding protein [Phreatobacter sp. AB_2022a]|uniref:Bug family tripartite tricarboxylate transporter substrate binding protein n=1 Tax=Phreatobacter sp. AB_2022a TaxID=3003134 RepID=UPI0022870CC2|nr:tripartite tricarboxylate transporter substrate-binding protein [Phreatobacter sp. AB_2022a]MCZ0732985.1 tripartite tricarboxylate transporter substrate-binding protein [Phreatobacter sp. AB_2022a]